jgi:hypothetical protein
VALPILGGQELPKIYARAPMGCGAGCAGAGTGCGA